MCPHQLLTLPQSPPADRLPPEIRDNVSRYRIELDDGRTFLLTLDHGHLEIEDGGHAKADCLLHCSAENFQRLLGGDWNLLTAFLRGDLRMTGDLEAAVRLYRFLRLTRGKEQHP